MSRRRASGERVLVCPLAGVTCPWVAPPAAAARRREDSLARVTAGRGVLFARFMGQQSLGRASGGRRPPTRGLAGARRRADRWSEG